jgi:hypothetical protein
MVLLQLDIPKTLEATRPIRTFMEGGKYSADRGSPFSRLLQSNDSQRILAGSSLTASSILEISDLNSNLYEIATVDQMHQWLYLKFYRYMYRQATQGGQFINQNYFMGD